MKENINKLVKENNSPFKEEELKNYIIEELENKIKDIDKINTNALKYIENLNKKDL